MAIFLPENQALSGNAYQMPKKLKQHVVQNFAANNQYSQSPGYKKALHLCDPTYNDRSKGSKTQGKKGIPFSSLKKLKFTLDHAHPKSLEYSLVGGDDMKQWVNDTLNRERSKVAPELAKKKSEELKNGSKPAKLTTKSLQSGNLKINLKESREDNPYIDYLEEYSPYEIFEMFNAKEKPWTNLVNPDSYQKALQEFTRFGELVHFPAAKIYQWFGIIMRNTAILRSLTSIAGHDEYTPIDEFLEVYFCNEYGEVDYNKWNSYKEELGLDEDDDYEAMTEFLDNMNFFEWFQLPDESSPWSDFGIKPLEKIISEYNESLSPEKVLVLLNKALDVVHCRGDLSSIFIQGGRQTLSRISEEVQRNSKISIRLTESQIFKLKQLLK